MHLALARKYRPQSFQDVIGQDAIVKTLCRAIETDRIHHAYLFTGVRGIGKTSLARILAKSINCEKGPTVRPCQECTSCVTITQSRSLDVIEIDGASNNLVDDVRELREHVKYLPNQCRYKIIIIDEVHMLSNAAFNALLKTLEEPPPHVIFIFATTEARKLPVTIVSRCQKYEFRRLTLSLLTNHLKAIATSEEIDIDADAVHLIAQAAQGSVRDAVSILDQIANADRGKIGAARVRDILGLADQLLVQQTLTALIRQDLSASLKQLAEVHQRGHDLKLFAQDLLREYRHLILWQSLGEMPPDLTDGEAQFTKSLTDKLDSSLVLAQYQVLFRTIQELDFSEFQKTVMEIAFVKMHRISEMIGLADLVEQIRNRKPEAGGRNTTHNPRPATSSQQPATDWDTLVKWLTREKPPLGSLLKDTVPVRFDKKQIEVAISPESQARAILIERLPVIREMIAKHFGHRVEFLLTDLNQEKKSLKELESQKMMELKEKIQRELMANEGVSKLINHYGARIKEINILKSR